MSAADSSPFDSKRTDRTKRQVSTDRESFYSMFHERHEQSWKLLSQLAVAQYYDVFVYVCLLISEPELTSHLTDKWKSMLYKWCFLEIESWRLGKKAEKCFTMKEDWLTGWLANCLSIVFKIGWRVTGESCNRKRLRFQASFLKHKCKSQLQSGERSKSMSLLISNRSI